MRVDTGFQDDRMAIIQYLVKKKRKDQQLQQLQGKKGTTANGNWASVVTMVIM
jgi:hypothetical protein